MIVDPIISYGMVTDCTTLFPGEQVLLWTAIKYLPDGAATPLPQAALPLWTITIVLVDVDEAQLAGVT